eukprot:GCRY01002005.1.p1 GENE.GCRY01002005.1~~GCRY01002005.1.p1  ORF type:complete len:584 (+),score=130.12 GCRY01002005.1:110-1753(+)
MGKKILIVGNFFNPSGQTKGVVDQLFLSCQEKNIEVEKIDLKDCEVEKHIESTIVAFVTSNAGELISLGQLSGLSASLSNPTNHNDFTIFGVGDSNFGKEKFNYIASALHEMLLKIGCRSLSDTKPCLANVRNGFDILFQEWSEFILGEFQIIPDFSFGDLEDMGSEELIDDQLRKSLSSQGYGLVGSHSSVKVCRWNKHMLRGRGGCYKHTFYGLDSHRCMECTTSLACANRCIFCWRHHSNPLGRDFHWKADDPKTIVDGMLKEQKRLVKIMRGIPDVKPELFEEAMKARHAAFSLVGEAIMYPHLNEVFRLMHQQHITTFLVTNAQFPDQLQACAPVTQLYLSLDAPTEDMLRRIDRPVFDDFWNRTLKCLDILATRKERTVCRLTLIKGWNMSHAQEYADLCLRGAPSFVELKGMTHSGVSNTFPKLDIDNNVPFHHEVLAFSKELCELLPGYELVSEHEHSCSVLLAKKADFYQNNEWNLWIDFDKFFAAVNSGEEAVAAEYARAMPAWALFGSPSRGFDPDHVMKKKTKARNRVQVTPQQS